MATEEKRLTPEQYKEVLRLGKEVQAFTLTHLKRLIAKRIHPQVGAVIFTHVHAIGLAAAAQTAIYGEPSKEVPEAWIKEAAALLNKWNAEERAKANHT